MRTCQNCGDPVTVRSEREGLIHKGEKLWKEATEWYGWYVCRGTRDKVAE